MNVAIANKLVNLRKSFGLSQEDLADKLGVSRQAVSKWERAESSPDTENLMALARIYNITLDEMLDTEVEIERRELGDIKKSNFMKKKQDAWAGVGAMIAIITFFATGFLLDWWTFNWVVYLIIPIFYYLPLLFKKEE